ncbi:hypothetical protein N658DRAFT_17597 [Parathielavia hyrcaniae]|uniref:Uncharacterized protein n=1 Tax=Parathielavia hyrcaniae TaxID=113614 RepID=A0AAN6T732_9PEZI|nr:hypothetical protein N658DRAFT_17597 [Parathielavia hyrcaniae]
MPLRIETVCRRCLPPPHDAPAQQQAQKPSEDESIEQGSKIAHSASDQRPKSGQQRTVGQMCGLLCNLDDGRSGIDGYRRQIEWRAEASKLLGQPCQQRKSRGPPGVVLNGWTSSWERHGINRSILAPAISTLPETISRWDWLNKRMTVVANLPARRLRQLAVLAAMQWTRRCQWQGQELLAALRQIQSPSPDQRTQLLSAPFFAIGYTEVSASRREVPSGIFAVSRNVLPFDVLKSSAVDDGAVSPMVSKQTSVASAPGLSMSWSSRSSKGFGHPRSTSRVPGRPPKSPALTLEVNTSESNLR